MPPKKKLTPEEEELYRWQQERHSQLLKPEYNKQLSKNLPPNLRPDTLAHNIFARELTGQRILPLRKEDRHTPPPSARPTQPPRIVQRSRVITSLPNNDMFAYVEGAARNNPPPPPPSMKKGGLVKKTGLIYAHKGEVVIPATRVATVEKVLKKAGLKSLKK